MILFIQDVILTSESLEYILWCDHTNAIPVVFLLGDTIYSGCNSNV